MAGAVVQGRPHAHGRAGQLRPRATGACGARASFRPAADVQPAPRQPRCQGPLRCTTHGSRRRGARPPESLTRGQSPARDPGQGSPWRGPGQVLGAAGPGGASGGSSPARGLPSSLRFPSAAQPGGGRPLAQPPDQLPGQRLPPQGTGGFGALHGAAASPISHRVPRGPLLGTAPRPARVSCSPRAPPPAGPGTKLLSPAGTARAPLPSTH